MLYVSRPPTSLLSSADTIPVALCVSCFAERAVAPSTMCSGCASTRRVDLALPLGSVLHDRYSIGRVLGEPGGFGITYLGWDQRLRRRVAIKEFFPRHIASRSATGAISAFTDRGQHDFEVSLAGFLDEARRLAMLDHANLVKVLDFQEANGTGYLMMNYCEGETLSSYAERHGGRLPWPEVLAIGKELLAGLQSVHDAGLLHRDVKPGNVYLQPRPGRTPQPILIDFGAARHRSRELSMTAILTEGFAPMEQYPDCGAQGPFTDVYAVAATLYAVITGSAPPAATSRLCGTEIDAIGTRVAGFPPEVEAVLMAGLAMDVADRPPTATAFAAMLDGVSAMDTTNARTVLVRESAEPARIPTTRRADVHADVAAPARRISARVRVAAISTVVLGGAGIAYWAGLLDRTPPIGSAPTTLDTNAVADTSTAAPPATRQPELSLATPAEDLAGADERLGSARAALNRGDYAVAGRLAREGIGLLQRTESDERFRTSRERAAVELWDRLRKLRQEIAGACASEATLLAARGERTLECDGP